VNNENIKVIVNGASGKMGTEVVKAVSANPKLDLVACLDSKSDLAREVRKLSPVVVVDFTSAEHAVFNTKAIIEGGGFPVVGTSGFTENSVKHLQELAKKHNVGGLIAPNFSLGAVLLIESAKKLASYFPNVEIIEKHHDQKKDSPSGTSLYTAEKISSNRNLSLRNQDMEIHQLVAGARGGSYCNIPIHSIRLPGFVAHQEIIFGAKGETIILKHDSIDRTCFMHGVCLACEKAPTLTSLIYGLEGIL
jgi:4-hydroxy-tetrahydrodipicolinate reductase